MNLEPKYYPSQAWFSLKEADKLRQQLPPLSLQATDLWPDDEALALLCQRYLSFYNIDFCEEFGADTLSHYWGYVDSGDYRLACHYWRPENPLASVVLLHGYYDHMGIYQHIIRFLLSKNYAVLGFDLPGHGLSSGARAAIPSFDCYSQGLADVLSFAVDDLPGSVNLIGQSTGCAAIMNYLLGRPAHSVAKVVLLAPLVKPIAWNSGQWLYKLLSKGLNTMPRRFAVNSHNAEFMRFLAEFDVLQPKQLSVEWVGAMKAWIDKMADLGNGESPKCERPLLIIQGTDDKTVDWEYNLPQIEQVFAKVKVELIENGRHQLVNESKPYREQAFALLSQALGSD